MIKLINRDISFNNFKDVFIASNFFIIDTETTGLNAYKGDIPFLIQIGIVKDNSLVTYVLGVEAFGAIDDTKSVGEKHQRALCPHIISDEERFELGRLLLDKVKSESCMIVAHNLKFDMHMLFQYFEWNYYSSKYIKSKFYDTMVHYKICNNETWTATLKACCEFYNISQKSDIVEEWISKNRKKCVFGGDKRYDYIDWKVMTDYAAQDIVSTYELYLAIQKQVKSFIDNETVNKNMMIDVIKTEIDTTKSLFFMERRGLEVDTEHLEKVKAHYNEILVQEEVKFMALMSEISPGGFECFVDAQEQIERYYELAGMKLDFRGSNGKVITSEAVLVKFNHPLTDIILAIRKTRKILSTYINNIANYDNDYKIRTNFMQCGANTLRMASRAPNIQNIPRKESDFSLRACFKVSEGLMYSVDFAAQEARVALMLAGEKELIEQVINDGLDLHERNAKIMGCSRNKAKGVFFGFLYGSGIAVIAKGLDIEYEEAKKIKATLRKALPKVAKYNYAIMDSVVNTGYLVTAYGNPLFNSDPNFAYKSLNQKIQGTCAIMMKKALVAWDKVANEVGDGFPLIAIHDEILAQFKNEPSPEIKEKFIECFRNSYVSMNAEFSVGMKNWKKC